MFVSIIIPAYNAEKTIVGVLEALKKQNFPKNKYEIIVVDDDSRDNTVKVAKQFGVNVFANPHKGPAYQRNFGAKKARGNIILFTDSDCIPDKNWIKEMTMPFAEKAIVGVSGAYRTLNKDKIIARFVGYEIQKRHEAMKKRKYISHIGTFSAAYRKNTFLKFKGFDTDFPIASGEDPELSYQIAKAGYKMVFNPKAFVWHPHPQSLKKLLKQQFWRGWWRVNVHKKHIDKIIKDTYITKELFFEILTTGFFGLFLIFSIFNPVFLYFSFGSLLLEILSSLKFSFWVGKYDKKISVVAPFVIFLRNIFFTAGFVLSFILSILRLK